MAISSSRTDPPGSPRHISVLCIDDDRDILLITKLSLEFDTNITVECASNADEALRMILRPDYHPDCILLDETMPQVSGTLLLGEIRSMPRHRTTPVIFLTACVRNAKRQDFLDLGALGTISKPFDPLRLAERIRELLRNGSAPHVPAAKR